MQRLFLVPLIASLPLYGACTDSRAEAANLSAEIVEVSTVPVRIEQAPLELELDGTLAPKRRARLSPLVSGHVAQVRVERGDVVAQGAPLVVLRATDLRLAARAASARAEAQLDQLGVERTQDYDPAELPDVVAARSDWEQRQDQLRRIEPLRQSGVVDDRTYEQARLDTASARARYDQALQRARSSLASYRALASEAALRRNEAGHTTVRAPFAGAVVERLVDVGEFVSLQTPIVELVDTSELRLELAVPERHAEQIRVGQVVTISVDGSETTLEGEVRFIAASLDTASRTLMVEVVAPNPDGAVRAGHFARAKLRLDGTRSLVRVPSSALVERAGVYRLYLVEEGVARARLVRLVSQQDESALLDAVGFTEGALMVVRPPNNLADGVSVHQSAAR